jgi:hypothetical protein
LIGVLDAQMNSIPCWCVAAKVIATWAQPIRGVSMSRRVSVPLDAVLLGFVERAAERESRTVEGQIRHFIIEAMRDTGSPTAGLEPWPPPLALVSRESLSEIKARMKDMEVERDNLEAAEHPNHLGFMPHDEVRLRYLRDTIKSLQSHIAAIERLTDANDLI